MSKVCIMIFCMSLLFFISCGNEPSIEVEKNSVKDSDLDFEQDDFDSDYNGNTETDEENNED